MVKAVLVVGSKKSGKTTVIEHVAKALKRRGLKVGTIKHVYHGKIDVEDKDTYRHGLYADIVGAISPHEYAVFFKRPGSLQDLVSIMNVDVLLIEGFKTLGIAPRIVCGKTKEEIRDFLNGLEICISGVISNTAEGAYFHVPLLNPFKDAERIADLVLKHGFLLPGLNCGACGLSSCYEMAKLILNGKRSLKECVAYQGRVKVYIEGVQIPLNPFISRLVGAVIRSIVEQLKGTRRGKIVVEVNSD